MTPQEYTTRRAKLISEFNFLKSMRLFRSAAARIRKIADLDYEYDNIPREKTKQLFNYKEIYNKG